MRTWTAANSLQLKRLVRTFRSLGATSKETARTAAELGCATNKVFRYLLEDGVIVAAEGQRYYLDNDRADLWIAIRRRRILIGAGILLAIFTLFIILSLCLT
ncbi:MAG: hypothetical protein ACYTAS_12560 [Planctomycetota bacterium]|jgi:hypothetical protein